MNRIDIVTEIEIAFQNSKFKQKDFLSTLDLENSKRAKRFWNALKRAGKIEKTPHKDFVLSTEEKKVKVA